MIRTPSEMVPYCQGRIFDLACQLFYLDHCAIFVTSWNGLRIRYMTIVIQIFGET